MRIVLLGPPGAGKGTQAILLSKHCSIPHISTGEIMRAAISSGSPLGKKLKGFLDKGELVPDALVIDLMRERLADCPAGFLLDGFPRTVEQAKSLDILLEELNAPLAHVIELSVSEDILISRIKRRGKKSGRSDDTAEIAAKRLQIYWEETAPVTKFYEDAGKVQKIDGLGTVEEVQQRILNIVS